MPQSFRILIVDDKILEVLMVSILCIIIAAIIGAFVIVLLFTLISSTCSRLNFKCKNWVAIAISSVVVLVIAILLFGSAYCPF